MIVSLCFCKGMVWTEKVLDARCGWGLCCLWSLIFLKFLDSLILFLFFFRSASFESAAKDLLPT